MSLTIEKLHNFIREQERDVSVTFYNKVKQMCKMITVILSSLEYEEHILKRVCQEPRQLTWPPVKVSYVSSLMNNCILRPLPPPLTLSLAGLQLPKFLANHKTTKGQDKSLDKTPLMLKDFSTEAIQHLTMAEK